MNKPQFRIIKSTYYSNNKPEFEEYCVYMNSRAICSGVREDIEELYEQLTIALNDRKEVKSETPKE